MSRDWISRFNVKDIRAFLDALPEPASDDWQDVTDIRQIRRGDMLKNETENALITYKYAVKRVDLSDGIIHFDNDELVFWHNKHTYYRLPAPVQHPDPAEHQYILVHRADPKYNRHMFPNVGMTSGKNGYGVGKIYISAEHILEWEELTPAKVVADDE